MIPKKESKHRDLSKDVNPAHMIISYEQVQEDVTYYTTYKESTNRRGEKTNDRPSLKQQVILF